MPFLSIPSPPFPSYLVPGQPFRRRKSSTDSNSSAASSSSTSPTDSTTTTTSSYLTASATSHLRCAKCLSDLAFTSQIISKGFTGRHGRAYLVAPSPPEISSSMLAPPLHHLPTASAKNRALPDLPNTFTDRPVARQLVTGAHTVCDIHCAVCGLGLGWKYVAAEEEGQRYKVGKFILETKRVCRSSNWEEAEGGARDVTQGKRSSALLAGEVEFDSEDEDECEDLFLGVWTPQSAAKRRRAKRAAAAAA